MTTPVLTPQTPDPLVEETRGFWRETGRNLARGSADSLDGAAKQLVAVAGILVGLYFHGVAFTDLHGRVGGGQQIVYLTPIGLLLLSLLFSLWAFRPGRWELDINRWEICKLIHERAVARKLRLVRLASLFLLLGVVAVGVAMGTYLRG